MTSSSYASYASYAYGCYSGTADSSDSSCLWRPAGDCWRLARRSPLLLALAGWRPLVSLLGPLWRVTRSHAVARWYIEFQSSIIRRRGQFRIGKRGGLILEDLISLWPLMLETSDHWTSKPVRWGSVGVGWLTGLPPGVGFPLFWIDKRRSMMPPVFRISNLATDKRCKKLGSTKHGPWQGNPKEVFPSPANWPAEMLFGFHWIQVNWPSGRESVKQEGIWNTGNRKEREGTEQEEETQGGAPSRTGPCGWCKTKGFPFVPSNRTEEREKRKRSFWADNLEQEGHLFQKREK